MTIAQVKTLVDGKITITTDKIVALRALLLAHLGTPGWEVQKADDLMRDVGRAYKIMLQYEAFKTTLDNVDAEYTATDAAYTAARTALENGAAADPVVTLDTRMTAVKNTQADYLEAKRLYDYYNGALPATVLANFEAGGWMTGNYKY